MNRQDIQHGGAWFYHGEILVSAVFFALSTLLAKFTQKQHVSASNITFFRFFIGFVIVLIYMGVFRTRFEYRNPLVLVLRGVFNLLAVFLFYYAIHYTTITNANLLNLTYPIFVAVLSPIMLSEHLKRRDWLILALAGFGICLVINPNFQHVNIGDLIGLLGGFMGAFAVLMLCFARRDNPTVTVLFFMLGVGSLLSFPAIFGENFAYYTPRTWILLIGCALTGVIGQFALTHAFRHLTAVAGSVTGLSRVVMAAILGFVFLSEVPTWNVVVGSMIIFAAIGLLASTGTKRLS
ncbi:MAG: DMT family transporter [Phycisphaerae bacterium]